MIHCWAMSSLKSDLSFDFPFIPSYDRIPIQFPSTRNFSNLNLTRMCDRRWFGCFQCKRVNSIRWQRRRKFNLLIKFLISSSRYLNRFMMINWLGVEQVASCKLKPIQHTNEAVSTSISLSFFAYGWKFTSLLRAIFIGFQSFWNSKQSGGSIVPT